MFFDHTLQVQIEEVFDKIGIGIVCLVGVGRFRFLPEQDDQGKEASCKQPKNWSIHGGSIVGIRKIHLECIGDHRGLS